MMKKLLGLFRKEQKSTEIASAEMISGIESADKDADSDHRLEDEEPSKEKVQAVLRSAMEQIGNSFIDSLKTPRYKAAIETVDNLEDMSDEDFEKLVWERCKQLKGWSLSDVKKFIEGGTSERNKNEPLSSRELILLGVQSRIDSQNYDSAERDAAIVPAEERIKNAIPCSQGLYPHEILLLDYIKSFKYNTERTEFSGFWWYDYGVKDVLAVVRSLEERGFIKPGDLRSALSSYNASEIKETLIEYGLKRGGKKDELVQRALDDVPHVILEKNTHAALMY